jgi:hypothetical protein
MYVKKESEYQNNPVIKTVIEVLTSGATIAAADFDTNAVKELKAGSIVGKDSNGLFHFLKTAKVHANVAIDATVVQVKKGHTFKVGEVVVDTALALKADKITAIDTSNADYDSLTIEAAIGALSAGAIIVKAAAEAATAGTGVFAYTPIGLTINSVDLTLDNQHTGVLVRGTVNETNMPQYVDANIKASLPLIRFE